MDFEEDLQLILEVIFQASAHLVFIDDDEFVFPLVHSQEVSNINATITLTNHERSEVNSITLKYFDKSNLSKCTLETTLFRLRRLHALAIPAYKKQFCQEFLSQRLSNVNDVLVKMKGDGGLSAHSKQFILCYLCFAQNIQYISFYQKRECCDRVFIRDSYIRTAGDDDLNSTYRACRLLQEKLLWTDVDTESITFICRVASSLRKDQRLANQPVQSLVIARTRQSHDQIHQDARHGKEIEKQIDMSRILTCGDDEGGSDRCGGVRALPADPAQGLALMEFFSGIGGMRIAIPNVIRGYRVTSITAFDCSDTANEVYDLNFHSSLGSIYCQDRAVSDTQKSSGQSAVRPINSKLCRILIDGLKVADVDGKADIWTMSPPCQPYTTTRNAASMDIADNRSRGFFHLMDLLLQMRQRPRWIVLENVKGFMVSKALSTWQQVLRTCGYEFRQYLLTPVQAVGLPNHRLRFYMVCEHTSSEWAARLRRPTTQISSVNEEVMVVEGGLEGEVQGRRGGAIAVAASRVLAEANYEVCSRGDATNDTSVGSRGDATNDTSVAIKPTARQRRVSDFTADEDYNDEDEEGDDDGDNDGDGDADVCVDLDYENASQGKSRRRREVRTRDGPDGLVAGTGMEAEGKYDEILEEEYINAKTHNGSSDEEHVYTELPALLRARYPQKPCTLGELFASLSKPSHQTARSSEMAARVKHAEEPFESLDVPARVLTSPWAASRLSIVGPFDRRTYCFTKSYGHRYDKSSGSCYFDSARGPLDEEPYKIDRSDMPALAGCLRLFCEDELLAVAGFPAGFRWPTGMPRRKRFACIGNSINVEVVRAVMLSLFDTSIPLD